MSREPHCASFDEKTIPHSEFNEQKCERRGQSIARDLLQRLTQLLEPLCRSMQCQHVGKLWLQLIGVDHTCIGGVAYRKGDIHRPSVLDGETVAEHAVIAARLRRRRGCKQGRGDREPCQFLAPNVEHGSPHGVTMLNQNGNLSSMPTKSANASRLPSTFISPDVTACSGVISPSWMRSSVVLASVILASALAPASWRS